MFKPVILLCLLSLCISQQFEVLVRDIIAKEFSHEGCEVQETQASRDQGVDAIAFDEDPIRGGKYVIQAKRYNDEIEMKNLPKINSKIDGKLLEKFCHLDSKEEKILQNFVQRVLSLLLA